MPPQTGTVQDITAKMAGALGAKWSDAHNKVKDNPVESRGSDCPPGVSGIARLTHMHFSESKDNPGKFSFYAAGAVVAIGQKPPHLPDKAIINSRTWISEPLYDTPSRSRKNLQDHIAWVYNEIKKFGPEAEEAVTAISADKKGEAPPARGARILRELQALMESMVKAAPTFKFEVNLGKAKPDPKTGQLSDPPKWHNWNGAVEFDDDGGDPAAGVVDGGAEVEEEAATADEAAEEVEDGTSEDGPDLDDLAARADAKDKKAKEELVAIAEGLGVKGEVEDAETWAAGAEIIRAKMAEADGGEPQEENAAEEEGEAPAYEPQLGDTVSYQPRDAKGRPLVNAKTKKPVPAVSCKVKAVNTKEETAELLSHVDKKTVYKNVPWSLLET